VARPTSFAHMAILDRYAGFIVDLDGAFWRPEGVSKEAGTFLSKAVRAGREVGFVTNDSSRTPHQVAKELEAAKVTVDPSRIVTSATAAATLIAGSDHPRTLAIGGTGLVAALAEAMVPLVQDPSEAEAVVVGWDAATTLDDLRRAAAAIDQGARFVGTSPEATLMRGGQRWPGPGSLLALLRTATGAAAEIVGKPNTLMFELAAERMAVDGPVLVVGDGVDTDLAAANRLGWDTALIVGSVTGYVALLEAERAPAYVIPGIGALVTDEPATVRHAVAGDLSAIHNLLAAAGFDQERAAARLQTTLVAQGPDGELVGTISWELVDNAAHLRGITIARKERGHGTGSLLVTRALMELRRTSCEWVYLLTPGGEQMFESLGFYRVQRDRVPVEILETAQFGAPADQATALVRRLR
jgi:HAD superfamily hydrolase (TIGR01450 family)